MAGVILAILGATELLLAFVFWALAFLFMDPGSLPAWVDIGAVSNDAVSRLVVLGLATTVFATLQAGIGVAMARGHLGLAVRSVAALLAAAGTMAAMLGSLVTGGLNPVFLPIMALYAYVFVAVTLDPILDRRAGD